MFPSLQIHMQERLSRVVVIHTLTPATGSELSNRLCSVRARRARQDDPQRGRHRPGGPPTRHWSCLVIPRHRCIHQRGERDRDMADGVQQTRRPDRRAAPPGRT